MKRRPRWVYGFVFNAAVIVLCACAGPPAAPLSQSSTDPQTGPPRAKTLTVGVTGALSVIGTAAAGQAGTGGFVAMSEIHTDGLITSDVARKPIGRLAARVPSLEEGTVSLLPDGGMRVVFNLRSGVTWHDGTPFTAQDLVFTYQMEGLLPHTASSLFSMISSVEAPDPLTFVINYREPFSPGILMGPLMFWPVPQHLLQDSYTLLAATGNPEDLFRDPYWTTGYVNTGPFKVTRFDHGVGVDFEAHDRYFLGRPKVDILYVRLFNDESVLFSSLLAGAVDMAPELALRQSSGVPLQQAWQSSGDGAVHISQNSLRQLVPQMRPALQTEPANLDPRVRVALYHALDRDTISDVANGGNPQLAAWSVLASSDPAYEATKDTLRVFYYDPRRATALLQDLGWTLGPDRLLRQNTDGRTFRTRIQASPGSEVEIGSYAAYWRAIGLEVEEHVITAAEGRDRALRAQYPGWDVGAVELFNMMGNRAATAETSWTGNRSGYEDPTAQRLAAAFRSSIALPERMRTVTALNEYFTNQLPALPTYFQAAWIAARKGVKAFDDFAGGGASSAGYAGYWGTYYRNSHLWDIQ